jgi:hypothetical protein
MEPPRRRPPANPEFESIGTMKKITSSTRSKVG